MATSSLRETRIALIVLQYEFVTGYNLSNRTKALFKNLGVGRLDCASLFSFQIEGCCSLVRLTTHAQRGAFEKFTQRFYMEIPSENAAQDSGRVESVADAATSSEC